jgi:putative ATP-dependent endonuclease of the OLD family
MPVQFDLNQLRVRRFRGIAEIDLDLPARVPPYLIGGNNACKSTTMYAVALAFRGGGTHQFTPERFDFFHSAVGDAATDFSISVKFRAVDDSRLPVVQAVGPPVRVHGVEVKGTTDKKGRYSHRHVLLDGEAKPILLLTRTPIRADLKETYKDHGMGTPRVYARLDDIRDHLPDVWLLSADNLKDSLYRWRTGPLQRLSKLLARRFLEHEWKFPFKGKDFEMPGAIRNAHGFLSDAVKAFPFWQKDLKPKLEDALSSYLGHTARMELSPDIRSIEDWMTQQLLVAFAAEGGGTITPLQSMGDGWQSLIRLAALDVLSQYEDEVKERVILLFEEPETYLHPHLSRKMRDVLGVLAAKGWSVVCSTHSPNLLSFRVQQVVVRLWRDQDQVGKGTIDTSGVGDAAKFQEYLEERGGSEMLFARKAVLCEGKNDSFAIRLYLDKRATDLDGRGVSIIGSGGVGGIPVYAEIAKPLGIPWCGVSDEDRQPDGTIKQPTSEARQRLSQLRSPRDLMPIWPVDLEACVGKAHGKATPDWLLGEMANKNLGQISTDYPRYAAVCEQIAKWIEA